MIDLAVIASILARDRVAQRLAGPPVTAATPRVTAWRFAARRAVADRVTPTSRFAPQA